MVLRSRETGGDLEVSDGFPKRVGANVEIRNGGTPAPKDKTRIEIPPGVFENIGFTFLIIGCVIGILVGAGVVLPLYSWCCIGLLIGVVNPIGRPKRS